MSKLARLGVIAALVLVAACGPKDKKPTTPGDGTGGGGDPTGMNDGTTPGGGSGDVAGGGGDTGGGGDPGGGGGGGTGGGPTITPPNLDPDPEKAKADVEEHLKVARTLLAGSSPDPDAALNQAKQALQIDAASVPAAAVVAHAYYMKKLYDTAEVMLDELYKRQAAKENAEVNYVYGLVYDKLNKKAEAVLAYKRAIDLDGDHASARINLGVHQLANKQYEEASTNYEKVVSLGRDDAEIENALASAYRGQSGNYDKGSSQRTQFVQKAEDHFKKATTLDRNYGPAYYNLGLLFLDADPFPTGSGDMDTLDRLNNAKSFFDQYKNAPGVDIKLYDERMKDVQKLIKREEKRRKHDEKEAAAAKKGDNK
jgi:tetratricopeptide (TPR) repeat protein